MDILRNGTEKGLKALFARAQAQLNERMAVGQPAVGEAFVGVLNPEGCIVVASRDFEWSTLTKLAETIRTDDETLVIFPEPFMGVIGDQNSRWVISGYQSCQVTRAQALEHAVCVVKRGAVVFIDWSPPGEGALIVPRSAAEIVIYGIPKP